MAFKTIKSHQVVPETPEALLFDIKHKAIAGPLSHQSDMWRNYQKFAINEKDVAMELPTGSGKTLVGIVLAEWRRKKFGDRVVYLCPTKQLVNQVVEQSIEKYKINVSGFTGKKSDFLLKDRLAFQNAESIAITTYSALFNINPFFDDVDIIILDDAHAAENYVGKFWTLEISRFDTDNGGDVLYREFATLIKSKLNPINEKRMLGTTDDMDYDWVDKLSTSEFRELQSQIVSLLNHRCNDGTLSFQWNVIREHLHACHCYISSTSILIRPLIPPTETHLPFSKAKQRIYMSATLGQGGDLERITGRKKIFRLPIPEGWDQQGIGRRYFIFPERSLETDDVHVFLDYAIKLAGRSVYLVKDGTTADERKKHIEEDLKIPTFSGYDLEISKEPFFKASMAVAILANRYDGIDFPDDTSHMLTIEGLPTASNLQERFFVSKMAASVILDDRIMTRLLQAMGRCTRSTNDYSAVIVLGEKLVTHLTRVKNTSILHPELQAELSFGNDQSTDSSLSDFQENFLHFIGQTATWREADAMIADIRGMQQKIIYTYTEKLRESVPFEIKYQEKLWAGDYLGAVDQAKEVFERLTEPELKGYRALWSYFIGAAYDLAGIAYSMRAKEHYEKATNLAPSVRWLVDLAKRDHKLVQNKSSEAQLSHILEKLESNFLSLGLIVNKKYKAKEEYILSNLREGDGKQFEEAQTCLGNLLGFAAVNQETQGAPDPIWMLNEKLCIVFEDYTDAEPSSKLSITKARQVDSHDKWIQEFMSVAEDMKIVKVLITDAERAEGAALAYLKDVYLWKKSDFILWTLDILARLNSLRIEFTHQGDLIWRAKATEVYEHAKLLPNALVDKITRTSAYQYYQAKE